MLQCLRMIVAFVEDLSSIPSTQSHGSYQSPAILVPKTLTPLLDSVVTRYPRGSLYIHAVKTFMPPKQNTKI